MTPLNADLDAQVRDEGESLQGSSKIHIVYSLVFLSSNYIVISRRRISFAVWEHRDASTHWLLRQIV